MSFLLTACHNAEQFHKPISPTEKTLNDISTYSWNDIDFSSCVAKASECSKSQNNHFFQLLTKKLRESLVAAEAKIVRTNCGEQYEEGSICGFDYNPIAGGQDSPPHYLYRTIKSSVSESIIEKCFPINNNSPEATTEQCCLPLSTYKVILRDGKWILDDIDHGHEAFNTENKQPH